MNNAIRHGTWWDQWKDKDVSEAFAGRFGRLFAPEKWPPADFDDRHLEKLAQAMTAGTELPPTAEGVGDAEEDSKLVSGYTYLGQFIDHDLTFDPTSHLHAVVRDLNDLVNFRTPRFDLDSLYGRGPSEQPYLYEPNGCKLLLGHPLSGNDRDLGAADLPRAANGRAIIGDPRNDENRIVAQLHATMIRFHNRMVDVLQGASFEEVREQVRWHYQWVVVNDFLQSIINAATVKSVFPHLEKGGTVRDYPPVVTILALQNQSNFFMPVEFSVAAYRFGHATVRPIYRLNETIARRPIFSLSRNSAADLGGMRPIPSDWAIDWQFFIDIGDASSEAAASNSPNDLIKRDPQKAYKIDTSVVNPLSALPAVVARDPASLPLRNLLRGRDFKLPSGQDVAKALGIAPLDDSELVIGKATVEDTPSRQSIVRVAWAFEGKAPLWAYILSEAQVTSWAAEPGAPNYDLVPIRLGPVGGRLVAEVFAAILLSDPTSFVTKNPDFSPMFRFSTQGTFGFAELIKAAIGRV